MFEWSASWLVYQLMGLVPATHLAAALQFFIMDLSKIFFILVGWGFNLL